MKKIKKRKIKIKVETLEDLKKDDRVFPFTEKEAEQEFVKILKGVGLYRKDPSTGMTTIRLHTLRKWFKTTLLDSGVPSELTEIYLGHYSKKLELAYTKFGKEKRRQLYKKVEPVLTIPTEDQVEKLERKLKEKEEKLKRKEEEIDKILQQKIKELEFESRKEIEKIKDLVLDISEEKYELKRRVKELENRNKQLEKSVKELKLYLLAILSGRLPERLPRAETVDFGFSLNDDLSRLMEDFKEMINFCIDKAIKHGITSFCKLWHLVKEELRKWDYARMYHVTACRIACSILKGWRKKLTSSPH